MEFDFTSLAFGGDQHVLCWDSAKIRRLSPEDAARLTEILDAFGKKSAEAQALPAPVTDIHRLRSTDQRLYLYMYRQATKTVVLGGIKVGTKRLFIRTANADLREIEPTCVLDFYVHESCQRQGIGKALFEHFLETEGVMPAALGYDRPSPKLVAFLRKHYGLTDYVPQSNNYVLFNQYWELFPTQPRLGRSSVPMTPSQQRLAPAQFTSPQPSRGTTGLGPPPGSRATPLYTPSHNPITHASPTTHRPPPSSYTPGTTTSFGQRWAANNFAHGNLTPGDGEAAMASGVSTPRAPMLPGQSSPPFAGAPPSGYGLTMQRDQPNVSPSGYGGGQTGRMIGGGPMGTPIGYGGGMPNGMASTQRGTPSGYVSRPPWAVDESVLAMQQQQQGYVPSGTMMRGGAPGGGMTMPIGGMYVSPGKPQYLGQSALDRATPSHGRRAGPMQGGTTLGRPPLGPGGAEAMDLGTPGGGRAASRMVAAAQRSGSGAADCLVW